MDGHPEQRWGGRTYAQHGDDLFLLNLFDLLGIDKPSYLDIGAHHPSIISNTKLLYDRGSRGMNVEANPELLEAFRRERPEDMNVNVGVGAYRDRRPFFLFNGNVGQQGAGRNTFSEYERDKIVEEGWPVARTMMIDVVTINDLLSKYLDDRWPDLLTMDTEGFDFEILSSATFHGSAPRVICVETRRTDSAAMARLMHSKGYFLYARMIENLFFVDSAFRALVY